MTVKLWRSQPPTSESVEDRPDVVRPYVVVESHAEVAELSGVVLDAERKDPVVVFTSRANEQAPTLDVDDVRAIVGPRALIYFLETGPLSLDLSGRLPDLRSPYNGSLRVWLPDVSAASDRREHPSVFDPAGEYGLRSLRQLAYQLRDAFAARGIEPEVDPWLAYRSLQTVRIQDEADLARRGFEEQLSRAREERDEAAQRIGEESAEAVKRAHKERDEALGREREAERRLRMAERDRGVSQVSAQDPEGALRVLILLRWLESLSDQERTEHPMGRYVLGSDFVRSADALTYLVRDRLAYVCAMVACERVRHLAALALSPLPYTNNNNAHQDDDGASAWQCSLTRLDSQTPPAVRYLQLADGTIKFTGMGTYKTPAPPGQ